MATLTSAPASTAARLDEPTFQAFTLLRLGFTVAPILFGIDKFTEWMTDWSPYLWSGVSDALGTNADDVMLAVGAIEIVAGLLVAIRPRVGALVVAAWLGGIIVNLVLVGGMLDIALRDFGLLLAALTLSRLATAHDGAPFLGSDA